MPSRFRNGMDDVAAELLAELAELREGEVLEVDRVVDGVLLLCFFVCVCVGEREVRQGKERERERPKKK